MNNQKNMMSVAVGVALATALGLGVSLGSDAPAHATSRARAATAMQTIDAKTDPAAAGKALDDFCQVIANCQFVGTQPIAVKYDAPRVLGDALYNCGGADAEDEVAISDERSESTSVDESLSAKVKLSFLGLASSSIEAEVRSGQLDAVATTLKQTNTVAVAPGTIGYTETRVPTAYLTGDAHVTSGVNLITITNLELTYPGYGNSAIKKVDWTNVHRDMTAHDRADHCAGLPPLYSTATASLRQAPGNFRLVVCARPAGTSGRRTRAYRTCAKRDLITDSALPISSGTNATLARGRRVYATGTAGRSGLVVRARRKVRPGPYTMILSRPHDTTLIDVTIR